MSAYQRQLAVQVFALLEFLCGDFIRVHRSSSVVKMLCASAPPRLCLKPNQRSPAVLAPVAAGQRQSAVQKYFRHLPPAFSPLSRNTSSGFATFSPSDAEKGVEAEREKPYGDFTR